MCVRMWVCLCNFSYPTYPAVASQLLTRPKSQAKPIQHQRHNSHNPHKQKIFPALISIHCSQNLSPCPSPIPPFPIHPPLLASILRILIPYITHKRRSRRIKPTKPLPNLNTKCPRRLLSAKLIRPQRHNILLCNVPRASVINTISSR